MTKISLELDAALNKRLKQYALDHYDIPHGKQQMIIRNALIAFLDANESIEIQPESVTEEVEEVCEPEITAKPIKKPKKPKTRRKLALTEADREYMKEQWMAGKGWTEIGKGLDPIRRPTVVKATVESMIKKGEISESDRRK